VHEHSLLVLEYDAIRHRCFKVAVDEMIDPPKSLVGFAQGIAIGIFDEDCRKISNEEIREQYRRKGLCSFCGKIPTHARRLTIGGFSFEPLTVEKQVYEGFCLKCHTLEEVLEKPEIKAKLEVKRKKGSKVAAPLEAQRQFSDNCGPAKQQQGLGESLPESFLNPRSLSGNSRSNFAPETHAEPLLGNNSPKSVQELARSISSVQEPKSAAQRCSNLGKMAEVITEETITTSVNALVEAMVAFRDEPAVQKEGCRALRRLSSNVANTNAPLSPCAGDDIHVNVQNCAAIAQHSGGIDAVLKAMKMKANSTTRQIHREGIRVIRNVLCAQPECKSEIYHCNGVETIIFVMKSNMDSTHIQEDACIVLWSISFKDTQVQQQILQYAGIQAIIEAMSNHIAIERIQYHGCGALHTLSNNKELKPVLLEHGGFDTAIVSLREHAYSLPVTEKALSTLANLSVTSPGGKQKLCIMDMEEIETIVNAIKFHDRSEKVQKLGCYFLDLTSRSSSNLKILRAHRELRTVLLNSQINFPDSCSSSASAVLKLMDERDLQEI
jgi:hypothetical protein